MEVILTKVSTHGRTKKASSKVAGFAAYGATTKGHGMYTLVHGSGKNRVSETLHCSEAAAQARKEAVQAMYK